MYYPFQLHPELLSKVLELFQHQGILHLGRHNMGKVLKVELKRNRLSFFLTIQNVLKQRFGLRFGYCLWLDRNDDLELRRFCPRGRNQ